MNNKLLLKIITPEKLAYESEVDSVTCMTEGGEITILPGHIPLVSTITTGELSVRKEDGVVIPFVLGQGVLEVYNNTVSVLVNTTEPAIDVDIDRAQQALERARAAMERKADMLDVEFANLQSQIERNIARLRIGNKWKK